MHAVGIAPNSEDLRKRSKRCAGMGASPRRFSARLASPRTRGYSRAAGLPAAPRLSWQDAGTGNADARLARGDRADYTARTRPGREADRPFADRQHRPQHSERRCPDGHTRGSARDPRSRCGLNSNTFPDRTPLRPHLPSAALLGAIALLAAPPRLSRRPHPSMLNKPQKAPSTIIKQRKRTRRSSCRAPVSAGACRTSRSGSR